MTQAEAAINWCEIMVRQQTLARQINDAENVMLSCAGPERWREARASLIAAREALTASYSRECAARTAYMNACSVAQAAPQCVPTAGEGPGSGSGSERV